MKLIIEIMHLDRFLAPRDEYAEGGVTIAYTTEVVPFGQRSHLLTHIAVAVCQPQDRFTRLFGRELATGRLTKYLSDATPDLNLSHVVDTVFLGYSAHLPLAYRDGMPFVLSTQCNIQDVVVDTATSIVSRMHPKLNLL